VATYRFTMVLFGRMRSETEVLDADPPHLLPRALALVLGDPEADEREEVNQLPAA